jgi:hypothetical protein
MGRVCYEVSNVHCSRGLELCGVLLGLWMLDDERKEWVFMS